jgi:hypothetical protein
MSASIAAVEVGSHVAVDEAICGFQGQTKQKVTIPGKPTPTGLKIWILATQGYILHWIWHSPGRALGPVGRPQRRKKKPQDDPYDVNPTQAVVVALLETLPRNTYHVFLDNLFSSPQLFRQLRQLHLGVGATGTARTNAGLYERLVKAKEDDRQGHKMWPWGQLQAWPTEDNLVNQIGWKDNALVVFLSTVYSGTETVDRIRRRPTSLAPYSRPIRQEFGTDAVKTLTLPSVAADYNDYMGAVDIADQLRSYLNADSHSQRRGPARALTWTFLLAVALANSFLLQRLGQPLWPRYKDQSRFLEALVDEIFKEYRQTGATRQRYRAGDTSTPLSQHNHVNRHKQGYCLACQGTQIGPRSQSMQKSRNRRALGQLDENALNRQPRPRKRGTHTQWGCDVCNVAICKKPECWYFYHRQNN